MGPYIPIDNDNRNSAFGVIVEVLGWIMTFSCIFLMGMALNWFLYTRHEKIDRVFPNPDEINQEIEEEEEIVHNNSFDEQAIHEYPAEKLDLFKIDGANYILRQEEIFVIVDKVKELYTLLFSLEDDIRLQ